MKILKKLLVGFIVLLIVVITAFYFIVKVDYPEVSLDSVSKIQRNSTSDSTSYSGNSWLKKNKHGLWEMYIEGDAFERGYTNGLLCKELVQNQEKIFVNRLEEMLPSKFYAHFLKYFVAFFNRNLDESIDSEYLKEIYGVSLSFSDDYLYIGPKFYRILNYHAAHDIGHALQNMNLVACTSLGMWGNKTSDSSMLIGRNFDFYMGEEFAKDKIVLFVNPDSGYKFMSVTWGGMTGVVSGMNEHGLTVTLNASKSSIPSEAATPVSIIARKILQYARNIDQAYQIANSYKSFVSESFMIGSKEDRKVSIIEKTPEKTTIFKTSENTITCTNHFQGKEWMTDELNIANIKESPTEHRRKRLMELIEDKPKLNYLDLAKLLRNPFGTGEKDLGMGNEKALNQYVAHHSIIFNPTKGIVWVSTNPYQLGAFVAYDLNKIFNQKTIKNLSEDISEPTLLIASDSFLLKPSYQNLLFHKAMTEKIRKIIRSDEGEISDLEIKKYQNSNPQFFHTWMMLGDYFRSKKQKQNAILSYRKALSLDIPRTNDSLALVDRISKIEKP
jgi:isopenicillin-N N-acyltransferase like protein